MTATDPTIWTHQTLLVADHGGDGVVVNPHWKRQLQSSLHHESTLQDLVSYRVCLSDSVSGAELFRIFKEHPTLPGVIITPSDGESIDVGMISRQRFYEHITSYRYSLDVFWQRPICEIYPFFRGEILILAVDTLVGFAAQRALQRPGQRLYEPIVVAVTPQSHQLLDMDQLLLAHAQIHEITVDALRIAESKHRALLTAIPDLIFRISREGMYLYGQGDSSTYLSVLPDQVLGLTISDVLPLSIAEQTVHHLDQALSTGEQQVFESSIIDKERTDEFETRLVPCGPDQVVAIVRDVTAQKRAAAYRALLQRHMALAMPLSTSESVSLWD